MRRCTAINDEQPDLFSYPPELYGGHAPAVRGSGTSRAAADQIERNVNALQHRVLAAIRAAGRLTDEQGMRATGITASTYRPRRVELVDLGLIRDSGYRAPTRAGRQAVLWEIVP